MHSTRRHAVTITLGLSGLMMIVGCSPEISEDADAGQPMAVVENGVVSTTKLSAEAAQTAVDAALVQCASQGLTNVSIAVVDRNGDVQASARGDNAAEHTVEAARAKAYTSAAFGANTSELVERADENNLHRLPGTLFMPGGVSVQFEDASIGGIGVGGAPSGMDDETCAIAGLEAIAEDLGS